MRIIVDGFGGDNAPEQIVSGAVLALNKEVGFDIVITGDKEVLEREFAKHIYPRERVEIVHTTQIITNDDIPTAAIRQKPDSSLVFALKMLRENADICGLVSAGSTGAVLAGGLMRVGRIKGVSRPALCPILPTLIDRKNVLLIDCGANVDAKPINLCHFAVLGTSYHQAAFGTDRPKVGLLSNGVEQGKGNELNKQVYEMLKVVPTINFIGNIEAREILSGEIDVVVADGFSGNIALKSLEGAISALLKMIKGGIMSSFRSKIGGFLLKPMFKKLGKKMDYNANGGAVFIGLEKIIVKSHGSSKAQSIACSILQVKQAADSGLIEKIKEGLANSESALSLLKQE